MTAANGLGDQHDYTLAAAGAVRAQDGATPALDATASDDVCDFSKQPTPPSESPSGGGGGGGEPGRGPAGAATPCPGGGKPGGKGGKPSDPPVTEATTVLTSGQTSMFGQVGVPGLLIFAVACAIAGVLIRWWDPLERAAVAAGPKAKALVRKSPVGRRRRP